MKVFLFPGQGSQAKGMGRDLFDEFPELTAQADEILGFSIKDLCLSDPRRELNQTLFTQPAIFVVNALSYFKQLKETDEKPNYAVGHSLGEFNALLAAEAFNFETGLKIVKRRAELMSKAAGGSMAAILNSSEDQIKEILENNGLSSIDLANYNTPSQIVISGLKEDLIKADPIFRAKGLEFYPLNTGGAFHSRYMQIAGNEFSAYLDGFSFSALKIPVIANVSARPYADHEINTILSQQMTHTVRWSESIQYLLGLGDMTFQEIGYGEVLTKLVDKIKREGHMSLPNERKPAFNSTVASTDEPVSDKYFSAENHSQRANLSAEQKVNLWNNNYAIGSKVKSLIIDDESLETRTEAMILFGHRAAVYLKGFNGYFDLDEIIALN